jgi:uncharacterized protein (UPF0128 family)
MTEREFLDREIAIWGYDYIFDLIDRGYRVVPVGSGYRWVADLTKRDVSATLSELAVTPVAAGN